MAEDGSSCYVASVWKSAECFAALAPESALQVKQMFEESIDRLAVYKDQAPLDKLYFKFARFLEARLQGLSPLPQLIGEILHWYIQAIQASASAV